VVLVISVIVYTFFSVSLDMTVQNVLYIWLGHGLLGSKC